MAIQQLMKVPVEQWDPGMIRQGLQDAIELEFSTIPPYLCGMWSVMDMNDAVYGVIRQVVVDEMLHLGLGCNLLTAVGGQPVLNQNLPHYPRELPGGVHPGLKVGLEGLSITLVRDVFMQIEKPEHAPIQPQAAAARQAYATIGEFYDALLKAFQFHKPPLGHFDKQLQELTITGLDVIRTPADVERAITEIKQQGEGTEQSAFAEGFGGTLAHYYKFWQIVEGKSIIKGSDGKAHWDKPLPFPACYPMAPVPEEGYPPAITGAFNQKYKALMDLLQQVWNTGNSALLQQAIDNNMADLTTAARTVLAIPISPPKGNYGPDFRPS